MACNNQITVWRINALTGTNRQINQTRFCDRINNWRRRDGLACLAGFFFAFRQNGIPARSISAFSRGIFAAADAHNT
jgi:hypothetical protein